MQIFLFQQPFARNNDRKDSVPVGLTTNIIINTIMMGSASWAMLHHITKIRKLQLFYIVNISY